jgi:cobalt-precorrin 5A hydrolase
MKIAVFAYSRQGCKTARRVIAYFAGHEIQAYTMARFEEPGFGSITRPSKPFYGPIFSSVDAMVFVGSTGIAVREIAPHVRDKATDPAVVSIDELGRFCVPLLSGHIGGANDLALELANALDATPVITTATDINKRFSVDAWAARNGYEIASLSRAKAVSAAILEQDIPLQCDYPIMTKLPGGVILGDSGAVGIRISMYRDEPFERTLRLIPRILHLGIGCRKGTDISVIREAVDTVLKENNIDHRAVKCVASIDLKAEEAGLLAFCQEQKLPVLFFSAEELKAVPGEFTPSVFVQSITGVDNVCERAALIGAENLIVKKTARNGVTVALAEEHWEVHFG